MKHTHTLHTGAGGGVCLGNLISVVETLPSKHKALNMILNTMGYVCVGGRGPQQYTRFLGHSFKESVFLIIFLLFKS